MGPKFDGLGFPLVPTQQNRQVADTARLQDSWFGAVEEARIPWKTIERFWEIELKQIHHARCQIEDSWDKTENTHTHTHTKQDTRVRCRTT